MTPSPLSTGPAGADWHVRLARHGKNRPTGKSPRSKWPAPDRAQIEVAYGNRFGRGAEEHGFSVGLHMFSSRFLP